MISSRLGAIVILTLVTFLLFGSADVARTQTGASVLKTLKSGETIHPSIKAGETQSFYVGVRKGDFVEIEIASSNELINVSLPTPGTEFHSANSFRSFPGRAILRSVATENTLQEVNVYCIGRTGTVGDYSLRFEIIHSPSAYQLRYARLQLTHDTLWGVYYLKTTQAFDEVIRKGEEALREWRELNDTEYIGKTNYQLGEAYMARERFAEAYNSLNEALPYYINSNNPHYQAIILTDIGQIYASQSDYPKAIEYYERALPLWQLNAGNPAMNMVGWNLLSLGNVYRSYGEWTRATDYYEEARRHYTNIEAAIGSKESSFGRGSVERNLGIISLAKGDKQAALDHFKAGLEFFQLAGEKEDQYTSYFRIGEVYSSLGDYDQARLFFDKALEFYDGKNSLTEALILNAYGSLSRQEAQYETALQRLNKSLMIRKKLGDRRGQALSLTALGATYAAISELPQALQNYRDAQDLWKDIGDRYNQAATYNYLGLALAESKDESAARKAFNQSLELRRLTYDKEGEADTLYQLAKLDFSSGALSSAKEKIVKAIDLSEAVRAGVNGDDLRAHYLASVRDYYEFYLDVLMRLAHTESRPEFLAEAFKVSEMARARSLLESLSELRLDSRKQADKTLLEREAQLQNTLNAKAEYVRNLRLKKADSRSIDAAENSIGDLIEQLQTLRGQVRAANPRFAELSQTQSADIGRIQKTLLDRDTLLLSYSLGRDSSYVWLVSQNDVSVHRLPRRKEIEEVARRVYGKLIQPASSGPSTARDDDTRRLFELVLAPVADRLHRERLIVIADGALQYIPFGMLPACKNASEGEAACGPYLINDHEIINGPSASALLALRQRTSAQAGEQIAVIADPVFDRTDYRVAKAKLSGDKGKSLVSNLLTDALRDVGEQSLPRLIRTRDEARAISQYAAKGSDTVLLDFAARRESLTERDLSSFGVIHIATHGLLDSKHPELSGLVFSLVDESGAPRDGFLRLHEIYNLKLNAELVVLSACQTGLGKEIRGEGLVGLTRGFMYAGAKRVVASLWKVDDSATAELMKLFYEELLGPGKASPAAALRAAQLKLMQQRRWSRPNAWAAFTLQGEWK